MSEGLSDWTKLVDGKSGVRLDKSDAGRRKSRGSVCSGLDCAECARVESLGRHSAAARGRWSDGFRQGAKVTHSSPDRWLSASEAQAMFQLPRAQAMFPAGWWSGSIDYPPGQLCQHRSRLVIRGSGETGFEVRSMCYMLLKPLAATPG